MAVQTIGEPDFADILQQYDLGAYRGFEKFATGAGQTTVLLLTSKGRYVLHYYENRTEKHILFEVHLLDFLRKKNYPVPAIIKTASGSSYGVHKDKPYLIIEYVEGEHLHNPNDHFDEAQASEVAAVVARLHELTQDYNPEYLKDRETFNQDYCIRAYERAAHTQDGNEREAWLEAELDQLEFPDELPKGICHADLNYGNFLFKGGDVVAVLDFDMSFYTYVIYDVASLLYWWATPPSKGFNAERASFLVNEYTKHRGLSENEKSHIFDALKLIVLLGIHWSEEGDFESGRDTIERLNTLGRDGFRKALSYRY